MKRPKNEEPWDHLFGNELGRVCQGLGGRAVDMDTMFVIHKSEVPADHMRDVTYGKINCHIQRVPLCQSVVVQALAGQREGSTMMTHCAIYRVPSSCRFASRSAQQSNGQGLAPLNRCF